MMRVLLLLIIIASVVFLMLLRGVHGFFVVAPMVVVFPTTTTRLLLRRQQHSFSYHHLLQAVMKDDDASTTSPTSTSIDQELYLQQCINEWNLLKEQLIKAKMGGSSSGSSSSSSSSSDIMVLPDQEYVEAILKKAIETVDERLDIECQQEELILDHLYELEQEERDAEMDALLAHDEVQYVEETSKYLEWIDDEEYITNDNDNTEPTSHIRNHEQLHNWLTTIVDAAHLLETDATTKLEHIHEQANIELQHLLQEEDTITYLQQEEQILKGILLELHQLYNENNKTSSTKQ